ncbi:WD40-repeat-containing domain protein [Neurospora intermedia]|uniref:WD40-repeat-containing domain protein n=1 Tax=Neurospora intermedia TaxID=5142 RepID=A0ABR3DRF7_NEUIN
MDIHRCRFVPYPASAINAVAFSHSALPPVPAGKKNLQKNIQVRLAVGRANGDIEIWNPLNGSWHQELLIPGGNDRSIDGLVWVTDPDEEMADGKIIHGKSRLFSVGYTNTITEWDLEKARAKKHASGQHGEIWCLGVQPPSSDLHAPRKLVAGTVDGNLVMYSIEDGDLKFQKSLIRAPSKKVKMVSICFQSRNVVIVGCSNSTICAYDIRNGSLLQQMTLGSDHSSASKNIIVWSLKCLPNGDIVSGDSTGQVCIWDGKTYTQAQRIQSHTQDLLCLAVSADGRRIVSGGMDRRTALYEPVAGQPGRWSKAFHRRYHGHDVKTMASFEGKGMSVVVSGGPDASPVVMPLRAAGKEFHRTLPHLPQTVNVKSASKARFVVSWWDNEVRIWHLSSPSRDLLNGAVATTDLRKTRKLIAQIYVKGDHNITSAAISEDGTFLVASTATDIKAFQLDISDSQQLKIKKVEVASAGHGAMKVEISPDRRWLSWVESGSNVMAAEITVNEDGYAVSAPSKLRRLHRQIPKNILLGGLGTYDRNVTQMVFSPDSKMLSVADIAGWIDTWVLRVPGEETNGTKGESDDDSSSDSSDDEEDDQKDATSERWVRNPNAALIPKLDSAPVVLSFSKTPRQEGEDYTLLAITTLKQVLIFNPLRGSLADWSRRNTYAKLPEQLRVTRDLVKGVVWQGPRVWIYGISFLFMLDLSQDLDSQDASALSKQKSSLKRKRDGKENGAGGKMDHQNALASHKIRAAVAGQDGATEWVDVEMADADDQKGAASSGVEDEDDDYDEDMEGGELQRLRDGEAGREEQKKDSVKQKAKWWHTYQYRPILGIVPLDGETVEESNGASEGIPIPPLEVALVERPSWDCEVPPRYFSNGERER